MYNLSWMNILLLLLALFHQLSGQRLRNPLTNDIESTNSNGEINLLSDVNVSIQKMFNTVKSKEEFAKYFGVLTPRSGILTSELPRDSSVIHQPANAGCTPLLAPVKVPMPTNASVVYYPACILLERCGGCCYGSQLSCQPQKVEKVMLEVMQLMSMPRSSRGNNRETVPKMVIITEERHVECSCKCIIKKEDCDPFIHTYDENQCACECSDRNREINCTDRRQTHFWDKIKCTCYCRKTEECSTGLYFDHDSCRCQRTFFNGLSSRTISFSSNG